MKERRYKLTTIIAINGMTILRAIGEWIAVYHIFTSTFKELFIILAYIILSTVCLGAWSLMWDKIDSRG